MKASEFKLRAISTINSLIDTYFGSNTMVDKFVNSTLHIMVKQKSYMLDDVLNLFTDQDGNIDEELLIDEYSKMFGENDIIIDIRRYIKNDFVRDMLPNKSLVIKSDDILDMLK
jgi:hypothetical protein